MFSLFKGMFLSLKTNWWQGITLTGLNPWIGGPVHWDICWWQRWIVLVDDIVSDHLNFKGSTIGAIQHWPGHCKILTIDWSFRGGTEVGSKVNRIIHGLIIFCVLRQVEWRRYHRAFKSIAAHRRKSTGHRPCSSKYFWHAAGGKVRCRNQSLFLYNKISVRQGSWWRQE